MNHSKINNKDNFAIPDYMYIHKFIRERIASNMQRYSNIISLKGMRFG